MLIWLQSSMCSAESPSNGTKVLYTAPYCSQCGCGERCAVVRGVWLGVLSVLCHWRLIVLRCSLPWQTSKIQPCNSKASCMKWGNIVQPQIRLHLEITCRDFMLLFCCTPWNRKCVFMLLISTIIAYKILHVFYLIFWSVWYIISLALFFDW